MKVMTVDVPAPVAGLMAAMPPYIQDGIRVTWPKEDRERFIKALDAVLAAIYPETQRNSLDTPPYAVER